MGDLPEHEIERKEALKAVAAGNTEKAEALFRSLADEKERLGPAANVEAAECWRYIGALAFLHDTEKSIRAYDKATELDPAWPFTVPKGTAGCRHGIL